jgi:hypothetical protein
MKNILWVVDATGTTEADKPFAKRMQGHSEPIDATAMLNAHLIRRDHALATDTPFTDAHDGNSDEPAQSEELWEKFNSGIHPAALQEGGFAYRMRFTSTIGDDNAELLLKLSADHPDLFIDATFYNSDLDAGGVFLFHNGEIVLYSTINGDGFAAFMQQELAAA